MSQGAIAYRADIDGLRAVAVLSVLFFHINSSWLPGGFTGVDIFFVISGFLITRIISFDIEANKFSLRDFYTRRIKRILPVFYIFTVVTILCGFVLLLPNDFYNVAVSAQRAVLFVANLYFSQGGGYFDITTDEKPMLHMWSLSIEEQYYFIWPLLLFALGVVGAKLFKLSKPAIRKTIISIAAILIVLGTLYAQRVLVANPGDAKWYFLLQTRFAELMIGSLIALLPLLQNTRVLKIFAYLGGLMIAISFVFVNKHSVFPGFNALWPCVGAALLIYSGQHKDVQQSYVHRALSFKFVVAVGLLSYSLYLWHWPLLAYMRYVYGSYILPLSWALTALVVSFVLAYLSYRFVEQRFKKMKISFAQAFFLVFLLPATGIYAAAQFLPPLRSAIVKAEEISSYGEDVCHGQYEQPCLRGEEDKVPTVLVTGDSHAAMFNSFIDVVGKHEGWSAKVISASSCSPVFALDVTVIPRAVQAPCLELISYIENHYAEYDAVIWASYWSYQTNMLEAKADPAYLSKLEQTLRKIAATKPVYVLADITQLPIHPFRQEYYKKIGLSVTRAVKENRANALVRDLVSKIPNVHWIDLSAELSAFDREGVYNNQFAYYDDHHLNIYGARSLGEIFVKSGRSIIER